MHLIGLALHEEQDDVDKNFTAVNDKSQQQQSAFKFLEKSLTPLANPTNSSSSNTKINNNQPPQKKSNLSSFSIKSFQLSSSSQQSSAKPDESLSRLLADITPLIANNQQPKLLTDWVLDYAHRLLKLKHKIDEQQKQANSESELQHREQQAAAARTSAAEEQSQKEKRKNQIAEKSRAKVMAKLNKMQKNFMETYKDLYEETKTQSSSFGGDSSSVAGTSAATSSMLLDDSNSAK